jgi:hypothetical protein
VTPVQVRRDQAANADLNRSGKILNTDRGGTPRRCPIRKRSSRAAAGVDPVAASLALITL